MRTLYKTLIMIICAANLSACAAPILIGSENVEQITRSAAFGPYPDFDSDRCAALSTDDALTLYPNILITGRCNPNNHHAHDHEIDINHSHDYDDKHYRSPN